MIDLRTSSACECAVTDYESSVFAAQSIVCLYALFYREVYTIQLLFARFFTSF